MFDINFSELLVIGIVALVVIGPERLPKVARTAGHLFGRLQRYAAGVKADIAREMELDELRKFKGEIENAAHSMSHGLRQEFSLAEQEIKALKHATENSINPHSANIDYHRAEAGESPHASTLDAVTEMPAGLASQPVQELFHDPTPSPQMELPLDADFESDRVDK